MSQATGSNVSIGMQKESVFNVDPGSPGTRLVPFKTFSGGATINKIDNESITSNRNPRRPSQGNQVVSFEMATNLGPEIGPLLLAAMGTVVTTGVGPYVHTLKVGTLSSFLVEKLHNDVTQFFKYGGCKVASLAMTFPAEGNVEVSTSFSGAQETLAQTAFDATPTDAGESVWSAADIVAAELKEGGTAIAIVRSIDSLTIENNLDVDQYVLGGGGILGDIPVGKVMVTGSLIASFEDETLYDKAVNSTESSLQIQVKFGDGGGTDGNEQLTITLGELQYEAGGVPVDSDLGLIVTLPFKAYYDDDAAASAIVMELKNAEASIDV